MRACACCGEALTRRHVKSGIRPRGSTVLAEQDVLVDRSGKPHAPRCPDNPFAAADRPAALALAHMVQADVAASA